jgi:uncharacterized repeat protein (TIGR03837 family)
MTSLVSELSKIANHNLKSRWVIFCRVIDNLGDAGVCWRLAQQLNREFGKEVELVIDRPELLGPFGANDSLSSRITITTWNEQTVPVLGAITISAFACALPQRYLQNMLNHLRQYGFENKRYWFNLEYLSAQDWVESHHLLSSTKTMDTTGPQTDQSSPFFINETFFFPGFSSKTGGLIRESFAVNNKLNRLSLRKRLGIQEGSFAVSLFCYPDAPIESLCNALLTLAKNRPIHLLLTAGISLPSSANSNFQYETLPFLSQHNYDELLSACDLNFVRGEDSLVRAIWARNPFIWQAYPQDQATQQDKLSALLKQMFDHNPHPTLETLFYAWNFPKTNDHGEFGFNLLNCLENWAQWQSQSIVFCDRLCLQPDLAQQLVDASV